MARTEETHGTLHDPFVEARGDRHILTRGAPQTPLDRPARCRHLARRSTFLPCVRFTAIRATIGERGQPEERHPGQPGRDRRCSTSPGTVAPADATREKERDQAANRGDQLLKLAPGPDCARFRSGPRAVPAHGVALDEHDGIGHDVRTHQGNEVVAPPHRPRGGTRHSEGVGAGV